MHRKLTLSKKCVSKCYFVFVFNFKHSKHSTYERIAQKKHQLHGFYSNKKMYTNESSLQSICQCQIESSTSICKIAMSANAKSFYLLISCKKFQLLLAMQIQNQIVNTLFTSVKNLRQ
jgi:hypothetical protein